MPTTNVPPIVFTATGLILPDETAILQGVQADQNAAAGGNLSMTLTSPQGQIAQSQTAIIGDKNNQIALIANQVNPDFASGRWQDAIARIYFLTRIAASSTLVTGTCVGLVGATIPAGSLAQDTAGFQYASLEDAVIPISGSVDIDFQCLTTGPINCAIGALNTIVKAVTGWDTVSNATAGTPGTDVESRADFENRRKNSVGINSVNSIQAVRAAVLSVPNVLDAYVIDNSTAGVVDTGSTNYPVAANSIYVAVAGGDEEAVATAIWQNKSLGCVYNGSTSFTITDTSGGEPPYPTYDVTWQTPAALPVFFAVSIVNDPSLPSNITDYIKAAIVASFNGTDGGTRARIASLITAGRYYAGVAATSPLVAILSIFLGVAASPTAVSLQVGIDQRPTLDPSNITVTLV